MKRSKFTEEQVAYVLRQAESGTAVEDICRSMGISQATFYIWKKKYGELGASEVRRLRQLEEENLRLKKLVADLTLDKSILQEVIKKRSNTFASQRLGPVDSTHVWRSYRACMQISQTLGNGLVLRIQKRPTRGFAHANSGDCKQSPSFWVRQDSYHAATRRLEHQYQTRASFVCKRLPNTYCQSTCFDD